MNKTKELLKLLKENDLNKVVEFMRENIENIDLFIDELATSTGVDLSNQGIASISDLFYVVVKNRHLIIEASVAKLEENIQPSEKNIELDNKSNIKENSDKGEIKRDETSYKIEFIHSGTETEVKTISEEIGELPKVNSNREELYNNSNAPTVETPITVPKFPDPKIKNVKIIEDINEDGILTNSELKSDRITIEIELDIIKLGDTLSLNDKTYAVKEENVVTNKLILEDIPLIQGKNILKIDIKREQNVFETKEIEISLHNIVPNMVEEIIFEEDLNHNGVINISEDRNQDRITPITFVIPSNTKSGYVAEITINGEKTTHNINDDEILNGRFSINAELINGTTVVDVVLIDEYGNRSGVKEGEIIARWDTPSLGIVDFYAIQDIDKNGVINSKELTPGENKVGLIINIDGTQKAGEIIVLDINGNTKKITITEEMISNKEVTLNEISFKKGKNEIKLKLIDEYDNVSNEIFKDIMLYNDIPEGILNVEVVEDTNKDNLIGFNELPADKNEITLKIAIDPSKISEEYKILIKHENGNVLANINSTDIERGFVRVENIPVTEGSQNTFEVSLLDQYDNLGQERSISVEVSRTNSTLLNQFEIIDDTNKDGTISGLEDNGDGKTNIKITLPANVKLGEIVKVLKDGVEHRKEIDQTDLNNGYVVLEDISLNQGSNVFKIIYEDKFGNISEKEHRFNVDTVAPSAPTGVVFVDDVDGNGTINTLEDTPNLNKTNISVTIGSGLVAGDKIKLSSDSGVEISTLVLSEENITNKTLLFENVPLHSGNNSFKVSSIDEWGNESNPLNAQVELRNSVVPSIDVDKITIPSDTNSDGTINRTESSGDSYIVRVEIPSGLNIGDIIIISPISAIAEIGGNVTDRYAYNGTDTYADFHIKNIEGTTELTFKVEDIYGNSSNTSTKNVTYDTTYSSYQGHLYVADKNNDYMIDSSEQVGEKTGVSVILDKPLAQGDKVIIRHTGSAGLVELEYTHGVGENTGWGYDATKKEITTPPIIDITPNELDARNVGGFHIKVVDSSGNVGTDTMVFGGIVQGTKLYSEGSFFLEDTNKNGVISKDELNVTNGGYIEQTFRVMLTNNVRGGYKIQIKPQQGVEFRMHDSNGERVDEQVLDIDSDDIGKGYIDIYVKQPSGSNLFSSEKSIQIGISPTIVWKNGSKILSGAKYEEYSYSYENRIDSPNTVSLQEDLDGNAILNKGELDSLRNNKNLIVKLNGSDWIDSIGVKVFINGNEISDNSRKLTNTEMSSKNVNVGDLIDSLTLNNGDKLEIKTYNFHSSNPGAKSRESILTYDVKSDVQGSVSNLEVLEKTVNSTRDIVNIRTNSYDGDLTKTSVKINISSDTLPGSILFIRAKEANNQTYHYLKKYEIKNEDISKGYIVVDGVDTSKRHTSIEYGLEDKEGNIGSIEKSNVVFAGSNSLDGHIEMFHIGNNNENIGAVVFIKKEEVPNISGRRYNIELHAQKDGEDVVIWQYGDNSLSGIRSLEHPDYRNNVESILFKNPIASDKFLNVSFDEIKDKYNMFYVGIMERNNAKFANGTPYELSTKFNVFDEYGNKMSIKSEVVDNFYFNLQESHTGSVDNITSLSGYNLLFNIYNANSLEEYKNKYGDNIKARVLLVPTQVNNEFNGSHRSGDDNYIGYKRHDDMISDYNRIFGDNAKYEIYYEGNKIFEGHLEKSNPNTPYLSYLNFEIQNNDWQLNKYSYKIYKKDGNSISNTFSGDFFKAVDISVANHFIDDAGVILYFSSTNLNLNKHKIEISVFNLKDNSLVSTRTIEDLRPFDDYPYSLEIEQMLPDLSRGRSYKIESKVVDKDTSNIIGRKETVVFGNQYEEYKGKILESGEIVSSDSVYTSLKITFAEEFVNWLNTNPEISNKIYIAPNELFFDRASVPEGAPILQGNNLGIPQFDSSHNLTRGIGRSILEFSPIEIKQNRVFTKSVLNWSLDGIDSRYSAQASASTIVLSVLNHHGVDGSINGSFKKILETYILKDNGGYLRNSESTDIGLIYSIDKKFDKSILFKKDENYSIDTKINGAVINHQSYDDGHETGGLYIISNKELMSKRGLKLTIKSEYEDGSVFEKTIALRNNLDAGGIVFPINEIWFKNGNVKNTFRIFSEDGSYDQKYYNSFEIDLYRPDLLDIKIAKDINNDNKLTADENNEDLDFLSTENPDSLIKDVAFELTFEDNEDLKRFKNGNGYLNCIQIKTTAVDGSWSYTERSMNPNIRYDENNKKIYVLGKVKNGEFTIDVSYSSSAYPIYFGKVKSFDTKYTIDLIPAQPPKIEFLESIDGRYISETGNLKDGDALNTGIRLKDLNRIQVNEKILLTITTNGISSKIEHIVTQDDINRGHVDFTTPIKEGTTSVSVQVESINGNKSQIYTRHMDYDTKVGTIEYMKIASDLNGDGVFSADELNNDKSKIMIGIGDENLDVGDKILISHNNNGVVTEQAHVLKSEDIVKKEIMIDIEGLTSNSTITSKIVDVHGNETNVANSSQGGGVFNEYNHNKIFTGIGKRDILSVEENVDFTLVQNIGDKLKGVDGILINSQKSISLSTKEIRSMLDLDNNLLQIEGFSGSRLSLKGDFKPMLHKEAVKELGDFGNNFTIYSAIDDLGNNLYVKVENHIHVDQS